MPELTPDLANKIATARTDVDDIDPVQKAFMLRFTGPNSRWMGIAREERADWVTVYINRQSRELDWFPVSDPGSYFDGVYVGYRYVKGHKGKGGNPGMAGSIANLRTLRPAEDHVLLLHCSKQSGFDDLVKWYAGDHVIRVGQAPSTTEISGEGVYTPLGQGTHTTYPERTDSAPNEGSTDAASVISDDSTTGDNEDEAGSGWMADPARRKAVEMHAVDMAVERYTGLGFQVVERGKPFDLLCTPTERCAASAPTVHVEVKGSLGSAATIHLTRNEVADARGDGSWRSDLFIVSGISLTQGEQGVWFAAGGAARWIEDWRPLDDHLTPTDYAYVVPE